jgi:hypothetical protein
MIGFSLQGNVSVGKDISLTGVVRDFKGAELTPVVLSDFLEKLQEQLVDDLCGERYSREDAKFCRAATKEREFITKAGTIKIRLVRVKPVDGGPSFSPLLRCLGVRKRQRYLDDVRRDCVELAVQLAYGRTAGEISVITGVGPSKSTIHAWLQEGGIVFGSVKPERQERLACAMADGTKVHGINRKNEVNILIGVSKGKTTLVSATVNRPWKETCEGVRADVVVSDGEPAIKTAIIAKHFQRCILHGVDYLGYALWKQEIPKEERKKAVRELSRILYTLRNSVAKHFSDGNMKRLKWRLAETEKELAAFSDELKANGFDAWQFVKNSANQMLTFAHLALKGVRVPWTTNLIERLMGEIAQRVKNMWARWSTRGLQNLLNILLLRYTDKKLYEKTWEKYVYPKNGKISIQLSIT